MSKEDKIFLKELEIVFENCDSVVISKDYISNLYLGDIIENIRMFHSNEVGNYRTVKDVYICILNKLKEENLLTEFKENVWNKLIKGKDITQLYLIYSDDSKEMFFVDWNENNESSNVYQSVTFDRFSLIISINRQNRNKDLFISKRDYLLNQIDLYRKDLSENLLFNARSLVNQLKKEYLPDEIYLPKENNNFLRFNWFEDKLDFLMLDIYPDNIEIKIYTQFMDFIEEFSYNFTPEKVNLNNLIDICINHKSDLNSLDFLFK